MFGLQIIGWLPALPQIAQCAVVFLLLVYMLYVYRRERVAILVILLCWPATFIVLGPMVGNLYKIGMLVLCAYIYWREHAWRTYEQREWIWWAVFALFTAQFMVATTVYSINTWTIIFSQYARYLEAFLLFYIVKNEVFVKGRRDWLLCLFYEIGLIQIVLSVTKYVIFGRQFEGYVGSFSIAGGAMGTTVTILWFILLWLYRRGQFSRWDWLYVFGLLFLGFTTGKRAVMFILPLVVLGFMVYVQGRRLQRYMMVALAMVPLMFYLGLRLIPTLNPEGKVWGSFDLGYAIQYARIYQFGEEGIEGQMQQTDHLLQFKGGAIGVDDRQIEAVGRGGATIALLQLVFSDRELTTRDRWGIGFKNMYGVDYETFDDLPLTIHINHKGSATGIFQSYVTTGVLGVLLIILWGFIPLFYCRHKRLRWMLLAICAWEYFLYTGMVFRTPIFMTILYFIIFYTNQSIQSVRLYANQYHHTSI